MSMSIWSDDNGLFTPTLATAERAVLAAVLLDNGVWPKVAAILSADDFVDPARGLFWKAMAALIERGEPVDTITLGAQLAAQSDINTVGGAQGIEALTSWLPTVAWCDHHARIVRAASQRRQLARIGEHLIRSASDPTREPEKLRDAAIDVLRKIRVNSATAPSSADDVVAEVWEGIDAQMQGREPPMVRFHIGPLDRVTGGGLASRGGMIRGATYLMASRPGIGKTACAAQIATENAAIGKPVLFVALEGSRAGVMRSTLSRLARIDATKIQREAKMLTAEEQRRLAACSQDVSRWPIHIVDGSTRDAPRTVPRIEAAAMSLPERPHLIVIDHLLALESLRPREKEHERVADVMPALVDMAKRLDASLLVLAHIGRGVGTAGQLFRAPRDTDLSGGDSTAKWADGLLLLHREDKHPTRKENVGNPSIRGEVVLHATKWRGIEDNQYDVMKFRGEFQVFDDMESSNAAHHADAWSFD